MLHAFIWDFRIFCYLIGSLLFLYITAIGLIRHWRELNRKQKTLRISLGSFFILFFLTVGYGSVIEPNRIKINEFNINLNKTPKTERIKIVHLSDLHAGVYKHEKYFEQIADKIQAIQPDLILITGDFIYQSAADALEIKPLEQATKIFPTYAVTGNHEYNLGAPGDIYRGKLKDKTNVLRPLLREMQIDLLENQTRLINIDSNIFLLAGLKEIWTQPETLNQELKKLGGFTSQAMPKILLSHNPETGFEENSGYFDLILSGHTHGGQIRLPAIGPLMTIKTQLARRDYQGLLKTKFDSQLYISPGLGESGPRARLFCRPEIAVITLDL